MNEAFSLEQFTGPMDLLVELVKKEKVDILEVSIEKIIDKYLLCIEKFKENNIDIHTSYIVMAADLILLKSRKLLPNKEEEDEEEIITEEELRERIYTYQKYKEMLPILTDLMKERERIYTKNPDLYSLYTDDTLVNSEGVRVDDLKEILVKLLKDDSHNEENRTINLKEVTIKSRINYIEEKMKNKKRVKFKDLFESNDKATIIVTFLAILEMAKNKAMSIKQDGVFEDIYCERI